MMKKVFIAIFFSFTACHLPAQTEDDPLFDNRTPLNLALTMSINKIAGTKDDSSYVSHLLYYGNTDGKFDSINVGLKGRGNFRLANCFFPPLWVKIKKSDAKGTLFEGNKKLKLVIPCENSADKNDPILKEYLCYRLYENVSPYAFRTRLVNIDLTELRGNRRKNFKIKGILLEDLEKIEDRFGARELKEARVHSKVMNDTCALRFDIFQYLIANTDWSKVYQHNSKLVYHNTSYISIPYDFDMSGLVDAPYAVVSMVGDKQLPISSVTERYYRGNCRPGDATRFVRNEFISKEEKLLSVPDELSGEMPDKEIGDIKDFLKEFFVVMKDDKLFHEKIQSNCRE